VNIQKIHILTHNIEAQKDFYAQVLQLPVQQQEQNRLLVHCGTSQLFIQYQPDCSGVYHFAFNIPHNQFQEAKAWIKARHQLVTDRQGKEEFHFVNWNAHSCYFADSDGNILEFIARHDLDNASNEPFDAKNVLSISEVDLVDEDVPQLRDLLCTQIKGLSVFRGTESVDFCALGDDHGLFILAKRGREWYPESGKHATMNPVDLMIEVQGITYRITGAPYVIEEI
jgi:catechol-2,3-dioxygenase